MSSSATFRLMISLLLVGGICALAQAQEEEQPRLSLQSKIFNFGEVVQGAKVEHRFQFENSGGAPLVIRKVKASCGCTAALVSKTTVAPGESGEVEIRFDSKGRMGFQNLEVRIYSNDPTQQDKGPNTTIVKVQGQVKTLVQVMPPAVYFQNLQLGQRGQKRVTLLPKEAEQLQVTGVVPSSSAIEVEVHPFSQGGRQGAALMVTLTEDAPPGKFEEHLTIATDLEEQPTIEVPVLAMINPEIVAFPNRIPFYEVKRSEEASRVLVLERLRGKGLPILKVEANPKYFRYRLDEVVPGKRVELELSLQPTIPSGLFQEEVRIFIDHPEVPLVKVPVFGEVVSEFTIFPSALVFNEPEPKPGAVVAQVQVSAGGPNPIATPLPRVELVGLTGFEVELAANDDGQRLQVALAATDAATTGSHRGQVKLHFEHETVTIEVLGSFGPEEGE